MPELVKLPAPQIPPVSDFTIGAQLDGVNYTLRFKWNEYDAHWFVRVLDEPGAVVLMGDCRLVVGDGPYASQSQRTPPGALILVDTSGQDLDPAIGELGERVLLSYFTAAELAALG